MSERWEVAYGCLVDKVEAISPEAAEYLRGEAKNLSCFCPSGDLAEAFTWQCSPQGPEFWAEIYEKLNYVKQF